MTVQFALLTSLSGSRVVGNEHNIDCFLSSLGFCTEPAGCGTPLVNEKNAAVRALCFPGPPHGVRGRQVLEILFEGARAPVG